jgi:tyrosyl-tRNA synthetase
MTKDEIIEMADKAFDESSFTDAEVIRFAKLITEKEREACATICEQLPLPEWPNKIRQPLAQAIRARGHEK